MQILNSKQRWGGVQQTLHWLVVLVVVAQLTVGFIFGGLTPQDSLWGALFSVHSTLGLTILGLMLIRLLWRLVNPVPPLPETLKPWQTRLARINHWLLYLLLIGLPAGGYLLVSAHGQPVPFFWMELPPLIPENETLQGVIQTMHLSGALLLILLVSLHVAGALGHAMRRDGVLERMLPDRSSP